MHIHTREIHLIFLISVVNVLTFFIQSSDDVVDIVGEEPPAIQDGGQHCCNGSACHCLIIRMFVHLQERKKQKFLIGVSTTVLMVFCRMNLVTACFILLIFYI